MAIHLVPDRHLFPASTANNRPVKFSLSMWVWYYTDTPETEAVVKVSKPVCVINNSR